MVGIINSVIKKEDDLIPAAAGAFNPLTPGPQAQSTSAPAATLAPKPVTTPAAPKPGYTPEKISFEADDTVEGRVANIVKSDSPLNALARTGAAQTANRRGLLNSSMAAGEAEKAVLQTALPIAQQDAQSSLAVKQSNQAAQNQMLGQQMQGEQSLSQIDRQGKINSNLNFENFTYEKNMQQLRGDQAKQLSEIETRASQIGQATSSMSVISSQVNAAIGEILANENIPAASKRQLIDLQLSAYRSQLGVIGGMNNLDLTTLLDFSSMGGTGVPDGYTPTKPTTGTGTTTPTTPSTGTGTNTGSVTGGNAGFTDYVSAQLRAAGGRPSETVITSSLDEAVRQGLDADAVYTSMRMVYPSVSREQFTTEVTNRGYTFQDGKIYRENVPAGGSTGGGTTNPQQTYADSVNAFQNFVGDAFPQGSKGPDEQGIISVLTKARELGIAPRNIYNALTAYFPDVSYYQFQSELANRGFTDLMESAE